MTSTITRYVALGDSFTEGLNDPDPTGTPDRFRGWADRLAESLVTSPAGSPDLEYANLAVRGRLLERIIDEQIPRALALEPDFVTICAGGNDCIRPGTDVEFLAESFERAITVLREEGIRVLIVNGFDTYASSPLFRTLRPKVAVYNCHLWTIAQRHGCQMLDIWGLRELYAAECWSEDRLHLSSTGHTLVAEEALSTLERSWLFRGGVPGESAHPDEAATVLAEGSTGVVGGQGTSAAGSDGAGATDDPAESVLADEVAATHRATAGPETHDPRRGFKVTPRPPRPVRDALMEESVWFREYFVPWVSRRLRGVSSGDAVRPKRPVPTPVVDPEAPDPES
ncbi:SGNH/GDSL hydrolase family protein [Brevibacterium litoralis]|uniref:SGNH/GDSL hydrolase family protein n=1 Tax=Brevibacterium litoralis TaxID=3138935 RepID=UPI0032ED815B